jgi:hypothetical protein
MMGFKQPGGVFQEIYDELASKFEGIVEAFRVLSGTRPGHADTLDLSGLLTAGLQPVGFGEN